MNTLPIVTILLTCCVFSSSGGWGWGWCPPDDGSVEPCDFDPSVNCLDDSACPEGQLCCPQGCNNICKTAVTTVINPLFECPPPSGMAGICVFDPEYNCLSHSDCIKNGQLQLCCPEGCGKVCMEPVVIVPERRKTVRVRDARPLKSMLGLD